MSGAIRVVYAIETRQVPLPGGGYGMVPKGSHWPADDPIVVANAEVFSTDPRWGMLYSTEPAGYHDPIVEQATAAPGERRATRRPEPEDDEVAALRSEAIRLGLTVDARWGAKRLREALENVANAG